MKYALALLVVASLMITIRFSRTTANFTIKNFSRYEQQTNFTVSVDQKVVFKGLVDDDEPSKFKLRLSRGQHVVVVRSSDGELVHSTGFKGNVRINIKIDSDFPIDPVTKLPVPGAGLTRRLGIEVADWDYPTNNAYVEIPGNKRQ